MFWKRISNLGRLTAVVYTEFIKKCRELAGKRIGRELSRDDFAEMCSTPQKSYGAGHIRNMEEGSADPGRELLEAAAIAAGFKFEDCILLPIGTVTDERALRTFSDALSDYRRKAAIDAVLELAGMPPPNKIRRPKTGGRSRKNSQ